MAVVSQSKIEASQVNAGLKAKMSILCKTTAVRTMLTEEKKTKVHGDYDRRWMSDDYFDLIIWYDSDSAVHGFQLCYGKPTWERALTWIKRRGFSHTEVDSGEADPFANLSPILIPNGKFPAVKVMREFSRRAATLPVQLRALVSTKISEFVRKR